MRLAALCIYGTLLAFSNLPTITANPGEVAIHWGKGTGPCSAILQPVGPCGRGQEGDTCPYRIVLPPLSIHLPKQLRELEKIVKEVQRLKDNVDQLRRTCADCTANQKERESGGPRGRESEEKKEGKEKHEGERNWVKERDPERQYENQKDMREKWGTFRVTAVKDPDLERKTISDVKPRQKFETGRQGDKLAKDENENERNTDEEENTDDNHREMEGTKGKNRLWEASVQAGVEKGQTQDKVGEKVSGKKESRGKDTATKKDTNRTKHFERGQTHETENEEGRKTDDNVSERIEKEDVSSLWQDQNETKREMGRKTQNEEDWESERTEVTDTGRRTDTEPHRMERIGATAAERIVARDNNTLKQAESSGSTETESSAKNGEEERVTEREKTVQSVQRDSDGDLASSKPNEMTDITSDSLSPLSTLSSVLVHDAAGLHETIRFASSIPSVSSYSSHIISGHRHTSPIQTSTTSGTSSNVVYGSPPVSRMRSSPILNTSPVQKTVLTLSSPGSISTGTSLPPDRQMTTSASPETAMSGAGLPTHHPSLSQRTKSNTTHQSSDQTNVKISAMDKMTGSSGKELQIPDLHMTSSGSKTALRTPSGAGTTTTSTSPLTISDRQITSPSTKTSPTTSSLRPRMSSHSSFSSTAATTTTTNPRKMSQTNESSRTPIRSNWTTTMKTSSKIKPGRNPTLGQELKPDEKPKLGLGPSDRMPNSDSDLKPGRASLTDPGANDQKPLPFHEKPTVRIKLNPAPKFKPGKILKSNNHPLSDRGTITDQNSKDNKKSNSGQNHATHQQYIPTPKPKYHQKPMPTQKRPVPHQRHLAIIKTVSDQLPNSGKDPVSDQEPTSGYHSTSSHRPGTTNPHKTTKPNQRLKSDQKAKPYQMSNSNHDYTPDQEPEPQKVLASSLTQRFDQKPSTDLRLKFDRDPLSETEPKSHSIPDSKPEPGHSSIPPFQKHKPTKKIPKADQRPGPDQRTISNPRTKPEPMFIIDHGQHHGHDDHGQHGPMSKFNKKYLRPKLSMDQTSESGVKSKPGQGSAPNQDPNSDKSLKTTSPDQMPQPNLETLPDRSPDQVSLTKPNPRPTARHWPPKRPRPHQGATPLLKPKPKVKPRKSPKTTSFDFSPSRATDGIRNHQPEMPFTLRPLKGASELDLLSQEDRESRSGMIKTVSLSTKTSKSPFLEVGLPHHHRVGFTSGSNSWITSNLKTTTQPSIIPKTTTSSARSRNNIYQKTIPGTRPDTTPTKPSVHLVTDRDPNLKTRVNLTPQGTEPSPATKAEKMTSRYSQIPSNNPQMMSTFNSRLNSDPNASTSATSNPEPPATDPIPDFSTPSPRELRVKINQVTAFLGNSLDKSRWPQDKHVGSRPKGESEGYQESSNANRAESQLHSLKSPDVAMARDCSDHMIRSKTKNVIYQVTPDPRNRTFLVLCDMETHGGGWTLIQQRRDGSVSFNRTWAEYRTGFGHLNGGEFWLGNDNIHLLTRTRDMILRVELEDFWGVREFAEYGQFRVASERMRYRLTVGGYSGSAGDALRFSDSYDHNNRAFTTPDRDHDRYPSGNCGAYYSSGWWFDACMAANLNGKYYMGTYKGVRNGIFWGTWHNMSTEYYPTNDRQSFKTVKMMIRPKGFAP